MEAHLTQLTELKQCLETELADVYADRDRLEAELEAVSEVAPVMKPAGSAASELRLG